MSLLCCLDLRLQNKGGIWVFGNDLAARIVTLWRTEEPWNNMVMKCGYVVPLKDQDFLFPHETRVKSNKSSENRYLVECCNCCLCLYQSHTNQSNSLSSSLTLCSFPWPQAFPWTCRFLSPVSVAVTTWESADELSITSRADDTTGSRYRQNEIHSVVCQRILETQLPQRSKNQTTEFP